ncbi:MAG: 50S ribosomal protein L13 [Alphaproteobacteria bacterium]|jgi:large subunit ribosomal protein L13|nr:50S ribosomal protein L13 [Alphaproteobacteria bacterium]PHX99096.1 MAG: 50S ribosomal protein L13 [Rhodospirillaceae bacterium]
MKTYHAKPSEVHKKWLLIDAEGLILGRLAAIVATILRGKHKPMYTQHIDTGDNIIIINAEKVKLTGRKLEQKTYPWYSGYTSGLKDRPAKRIMLGEFPQRIIEEAVKRMMPKDSPLARAQFSKLKVYKGPSHPHEAQTPEVLDIASRNPKNKR